MAGSSVTEPRLLARMPGTVTTLAGTAGTAGFWGASPFDPAGLLGQHISQPRHHRSVHQWLELGPTDLWYLWQFVPGTSHVSFQDSICSKISATLL